MGGPSERPAARPAPKWPRVRIILVVLACWGYHGIRPAWAGAGSLTMTAPVPGAAFSPIVLSGVTETATDSLSSFTVTDTNRPSRGWHVTVSASQFCQQSTGASCLASPHTLPTGSLSESAPGVSGPAPLPSVYALSGIDGTTATLASAADKTSSGTYTFTGATLTLTVAPTTYAAQYVSTITYTLVSGP